MNHWLNEFFVINRLFERIYQSKSNAFKRLNSEDRRINAYLQFSSSNTAPDEQSLERVGGQTQSHFSLDHIRLFSAQVLALDMSVHSQTHLSLENTCFSLQFCSVITHWQPQRICFSIFRRIHFCDGVFKAPDFPFARINWLKIYSKIGIKWLNNCVFDSQNQKWRELQWSPSQRVDTCDLGVDKHRHIALLHSCWVCDIFPAYNTLTAFWEQPIFFLEVGITITDAMN